MWRGCGVLLQGVHRSRAPEQRQVLRGPESPVPVLQHPDVWGKWWWAIFCLGICTTEFPFIYIVVSYSGVFNLDFSINVSALILDWWIIIFPLSFSPTLGKSFREEQCEKYNSFNYLDILGNMKQWIPKYAGVSPRDRCKLFCRAKGSSEFKVFEAKVRSLKIICRMLATVNTYFTACLHCLVDHSVK